MSEVPSLFTSNVHLLECFRVSTITLGRKMAKPKMRVLKREANEFPVSAPMWADALALALRFKWHPIGASTSYLVAGFRVSEENAKALSDAFERVFDSALESPMQFYPIQVDMGELYLLKKFLEGGAFEVCDK